MGHTVAGAVLLVIGFIPRRHIHPDALGFGALVSLRQPHPLAHPA